jgi:hypothetical protein
MPREQKSKLNLEELTDAEVYTAIQYLDPELTAARDDPSGALLVILGLLILLSGCAGLVWIYRPVLW